MDKDEFSNGLKLKAIKDYVTPLMFGAAGNGDDNDTDGMTACVAYCANNNATLLIPKGYTIKIPERHVFTGVKQIACFGTIQAPNGIEFRYNHGRLCNDWYFANVEGALTVSGLKNSFITVLHATSLTLFADSSVGLANSISYNLFKLGYVPTLTITSNNNGWINENLFVGGRIRNLTVSGPYAHNHNHFYNNCFEGGKITFSTGRSNYIHNGRFEGASSCVFTGRATNNYVHAALTETRLPGTTLYAPDWWHDNNGCNYYFEGILPPVTTQVRALNVGSNNFNANDVYPNSDGETLHLVHDRGEIIKTRRIPINHALRVSIMADVRSFRVRVYVYDSNGDPITTQPSVSPIFRSKSFSWHDDGYYRLTSDVSGALFNVSRYDSFNGEDTGVAYIEISVRGPSTNVDIKYLYFHITHPYYIGFQAFDQERLTAETQPANGTWEDNTFVYNTDAANACLGWLYQGGVWHKIGEYST